MQSLVDRHIVLLLKFWGVATVAISILTNHFKLWATTFSLLAILGFWLISLSKKENLYWSPRVGVSKHQQVIATGPYAIVRHPQYAGAVLIILAIPLVAQSVAGALITLCVLILFLIRIHFEEELLECALDGYIDYQAKVQYKLLPWIF